MIDRYTFFFLSQASPIVSLRSLQLYPQLISKQMSSPTSKLIKFNGTDVTRVCSYSQIMFGLQLKIRSLKSVTLSTVSGKTDWLWSSCYFSLLLSSLSLSPSLSSLQPHNQPASLQSSGLKVFHLFTRWLPFPRMSVTQPWKS